MELLIATRSYAGVPHRLERNATGGVAISATQPTYLSSMPPPGPRLRPWK